MDIAIAILILGITWTWVLWEQRKWYIPKPPFKFELTLWAIVMVVSMTFVAIAAIFAGR